MQINTDPVKKYAVDLSELMEKKKIEYLSPDKKWFLFLQGVYRDHIERMAQIESFALTYRVLFDFNNQRSKSKRTCI